MSLPADVKPDWLNVIRRAQSVAATQRGFAIVTLQVVVDAEGTPVFWCEPTLTRIEPQQRGAQFLAQLISGMAIK